MQDEDGGTGLSVLLPGALVADELQGHRLLRDLLLWLRRRGVRLGTQDLGLGLGVRTGGSVDSEGDRRPTKVPESMGERGQSKNPLPLGCGESRIFCGTPIYALASNNQYVADTLCPAKLEIYNLSCIPASEICNLRRHCTTQPAVNVFAFFLRDAIFLRIPFLFRFL